MKKLLSILVIIPLFSCKTEVKDGVVTTCKVCNKEINNSVSVLQVPVQDKENYGVIYRSAYCTECGNQNIAHTEHVNCEYCGKNYTNNTHYAPRKDEKEDYYISSGYCDRSCEAQDVVNDVAEKVGKKASEIGSHLLDGIRNKMIK